MPLIVFAPAKINLSLHISAPIPQNNDFAGYHNLDSLVAFTRDIGDELCFEPANEYSLSINGPFANELLGNDLLGADNIIGRAHYLISEMVGHNLAVKITLVKNLPIASGIGGGSTNAAAAIIGIDSFFKLKLSNTQKHDIALKLGADVPVCLNKIPVIMRGIGNIFADAPKIPDIPIILANPLVACSTPMIYRKFDEMAVFKPLDGQYRDCHDIDGFVDMLNNNYNDLEAANFALFPEVKKLHDAMQTLKNVRLVRMSGSGGSIFAVFDDIDAANDANSELKEIYRNDALWSLSGILAGNHE